MKLVCLEILFVSIGTRAMLSLIHKPPPLGDVVWGAVTLVAAITALVLVVTDAVNAARRVVHPPHIPLDRIAPYRRERVATRPGGRFRNVSLN